MCSERGIRCDLSRSFRLRKPLVQSYDQINHDDLIVLSEQLPEGLERFTASINQYLSNELSGYK